MLPLAPPLEQEDKGVQVDLQDLGYETSGKSEAEVDREESSSTGRRPRLDGACLSVCRVDTNNHSGGMASAA